MYNIYNEYDESRDSKNYLRVVNEHIGETQYYYYNSNIVNRLIGREF